jgi:hypothetical protein
MAQTLPIDARLEAANEFIRSLPGGECDCRPFFVGAEDRGILAEVVSLLRGPVWAVRAEAAALAGDETPVRVYAPDARTAAGLVRKCAHDYFADEDADAHVGDPVRLVVTRWPPHDAGAPAEVFETAMVAARRETPEPTEHVNRELALRAVLLAPGAIVNCDPVLDGLICVESLATDAQPGTQIRRHIAPPQLIEDALNRSAAAELRRGDTARACLYAEAAAWAAGLAGAARSGIRQEEFARLLPADDYSDA